MIVLAIGEIATKTEFGLDQKKIMEFIARVILFNHLHIFFTPLLFLLPEFRLWSGSVSILKTSLFKKYLQRRTSTLFAILFVIIFLVQALTTFNSMKTYFIYFVTPFMALFGLYHVVFQTYGFFSLYERKASRTRPDPSLQNFKLHFLLIAGILGVKTIALQFISTGTIEIIFGTTLLLTFIALLVIVPTFRQHPWRTSNKGWYSLRLLLYAFSPISTLAMYGFLAFHGAEYVMLFFKMKRQSETKMVSATLSFLAIATVLFFGIPKFLSYTGALVAFKSMSPYAFPLIVGYFAAFDFVHYTVDGYLFRFRDAASKDHILPLITENRNAS